jgi:hypothetical protein
MVYIGIGDGLAGWRGYGQSQPWDEAMSRPIEKSSSWDTRRKFGTEQTKGEKAALLGDKKGLHGWCGMSR